MIALNLTNLYTGCPYYHVEDFDGYIAFAITQTVYRLKC